jgi:hypothetical protein
MQELIRCGIRSVKRYYLFCYYLFKRESKSGPALISLEEHPWEQNSPNTVESRQLRHRKKQDEKAT